MPNMPLVIREIGAEFINKIFKEFCQINELLEKCIFEDPYMIA